MIWRRRKHPVKVKIGTGVMSKDGVTPFALNLLMAQQYDSNMVGGGYRLSFQAVAELLSDTDIEHIHIIDANNVQVKIDKGPRWSYRLLDGDEIDIWFAGMRWGTIKKSWKKKGRWRLHCFNDDNMFSSATPDAVLAKLSKHIGVVLIKE
jgi:hypothetical protein